MSVTMMRRSSDGKDEETSKTWVTHVQFEQRWDSLNCFFRNRWKYSKSSHHQRYSLLTCLNQMTYVISMHCGLTGDRKRSYAVSSILFVHEECLLSRTDFIPAGSAIWSSIWSKLSRHHSSSMSTTSTWGLAHFQWLHYQQTNRIVHGSFRFLVTGSQHHIETIEISKRMILPIRKVYQIQQSFRRPWQHYNRCWVHSLSRYCFEQSCWSLEDAAAMSTHLKQSWHYQVQQEHSSLVYNLSSSLSILFLHSWLLRQPQQMLHQFSQHNEHIFQGWKGGLFHWRDGQCLQHNSLWLMY